MTSTPAVYFSTLHIENVRCFGGHQELDLTVNGLPNQWTLLIGENGVGKTTLLECLAWMRPVLDFSDSHFASEPEEEAPILGGTLNPALPEADNEVLETLPRNGLSEVMLESRLFFGNAGTWNDDTVGKEVRPHKNITVGARLDFDELGQLDHFEVTKSTQIKDLLQEYHVPLIVAYGANRHLGVRNLPGFSELDPLDYERFSGTTELCDVEELLMSLDYAALSDPANLDSKVLAMLQDAISRILPEEPAVDIAIYPPNVLKSGRPGGVYARTFSGLVRLSSLSLGYRTTASWVVDFAWRLLSRYQNSSNPLSEPAIVFIDEIDLHLHPRWQLVIMKELSELFPATQFIATSHSPLIVQVAEDAKLILLEKQGEQVHIRNEPHVPRNLRVDQILTSLLFGVASSRSPKIQSLLDQRAALLDKINRSEDEEGLLRDIRRQIDELPIAQDNSDQIALDIIRRFAARIEQEEAGSQ